MNQKNILFVPHSPSQNTKQLQNAVKKGATHTNISNVQITVIPPLKACPNDVIACDGLIIGTTENLGYMSGITKDFLNIG